MAEENELEIVKKSEHEDDDMGCYFLQPSSSPYNITEKVQQANFDLFNSTPHSNRSAKVKFRDELVSFEPDLTDDDVNSIESDHEAEELSHDDDIKLNELMPQYNTVLRSGLDIYDIEEEIDGIVVEEVVLSDNDPVYSQVTNKDNSKEENISVSENGSKQSKNSETYTVSSRKSVKRKKHPRKTLMPTEVHCKEHCIEKVDSHLSMSIKKLEICEKPLISLPLLQLHQRKCCDENKPTNSDRMLPNYNGYRSEYGLSSRQIKNRNRHIELIRQKELARQKLMEEYRALKIQQNEEVFCQWLKEISKRNKVSRKGNKSVSPNYLYLSPTEVRMDKNCKFKERPKTASFIPKTSIKKTKRPNTTQSCVFTIEVSPDVLKKGLYIGDLLVTNAKTINKKLQILTVT